MCFEQWGLSVWTRFFIICASGLCMLLITACQQKETRKGQKGTAIDKHMEGTLIGASRRCYPAQNHQL